MKNKILEIIKTYPKHYSRLIKKNIELYQWVLDNSLIESDHFPEMIYSAVNQESNICPNGNQKSISRFSDGWIGCGPANICKCTKDKISLSVSTTKSLLSVTDKEKSNSLRKNTLLKKYGFEFNSQRPEIKKILSKPKISDESYLLLNDKNWLDEQYNIRQRTLVDIADQLKVYYGTVGEYCRKFGFNIRQKTNYSLEEEKLCKFLDSLGLNYIRHDWEILNNKEIDIFIPRYNLGIEVNGLYWHSYNPNCSHTPRYEDKNRHLNKLLCAEEKGVQLVQFTDFEINNKEELIYSLIKARTGLSKKIYARECIIKPVSKKEEKLFLDENHLQNFCGSSIAIGLYHNDILVMIMTFGKPRYSTIADIELLRVCTLKGYVVVGGASKLFNYFLRTTSFDKIISYCDRSKFTGNLYKSLGFYPSSKLKPGYFWTDGNLPISRYKCQHKNLSKWLKNYNKEKSEADNLFSEKYRRYWDCGQQTWVYNR